MTDTGERSFQARSARPAGALHPGSAGTYPATAVQSSIVSRPPIWIRSKNRSSVPSAMHFSRSIFYPRDITWPPTGNRPTIVQPSPAPAIHIQRTGPVKTWGEGWWGEMVREWVESCPRDPVTKRGVCPLVLVGDRVAKLARCAHGGDISAPGAVRIGVWVGLSSNSTG